MPRKTFANGFPLPASDLNTYLMDQSVQTYADATARTAALATPVEGQMSYLADTNTAYVYDGSSWNAVVDAKNYGSVLPTGTNAIINGAFEINQRNFSSSTTHAEFCYDRFLQLAADGTSTFSAQTITPGDITGEPVAAEKSLRLVSTGQTLATARTAFRQLVENVRTFAGQNVTVSFWAKAASGTPKVALQAFQNFGSGGSTAVDTYAGQVTLSTSWKKYSITFTVPSISGKTIGSGSNLGLVFWVSAGSSFNTQTGSLGIQSNTFDFWGIQAEAGSVATPFSRAAGTLQGELAACQRYYQRVYSPGSYGFLHTGGGVQTTKIRGMFPLKTTMRSAPSAVEASGIYADNGATVTAPNATVIFSSAADAVCMEYQFTSGIVAGFSYGITGQLNTSYLAVTSEL